MDLLQELPVDQWPALQQKLLRNWPRNIAGYYALERNQRCPEFREAIQLKVYCPYGDMNNGFVVTCLWGRITNFMMSPVTGDSSKLEEALSKTKVIDWSELVPANVLSIESFEILCKVKLAIGLNFIETISIKMLYLDRRTMPSVNDIKIPDGTYLAQLKQNDISRVSETWIEMVSSANLYFTTLVASGLSYGLYSNTNELLAWLFISEHGGLRHLYCEKSHRKKGYAEFLLRYVVNEQLTQGEDVYGYTPADNTASIKLFQKLGFQVFHDFYYVAVKAQ